jgi:hypothetical protein
MPSPRFIPGDNSPSPIGGFLKEFLETRGSTLDQKTETDALRDIYSEFEKDGNNLFKALKEVKTRPGISPTTRVNTTNQLLQFQKHNQKLMNKAKTDAEKSLNNKAIITDLEKRKGLEPGSLDAYESDPKMAFQLTKESKKTQASQPIDEDQLKRIEHTLAMEGFDDLTPSQQNLALIKNGVSKENSKAVIDPKIEEAKIDNERGSVLRKEQAKMDIGFADEQTNKAKELFGRQEVLDQAAVLNDEGVTGQPWDQAMQKIGLLQYTSDGYRVFTSLAKDAVKNQNIKSVIGSQISQMEFGFFRDATINPGFSKEANRQIIKKEGLALRYEKLYSDITQKMIEQNGGQIPERLQTKVNDEFAQQAKKISKELKETAIDYEAIQNIPQGKVLMYDKKRRPLHVPANEVEKYTKLGASLS